MDVIKGVDFRRADKASDYVVVISNGSGIKTAVIACRGFSAARPPGPGRAVSPGHTERERGERWV